MCVGNGQLAQAKISDKVGALNCMHDQQAVLVQAVDCYNQQMTGDKTMSITGAATDPHHIPCVVYGLDRASFNQGQNAQYDFSVEEEQAQTLVSKGPGGGTSETVGSLCASDAKMIGNQYVNSGKLILQMLPKNGTS